jgi:hypothetical protein
MSIRMGHEAKLYRNTGTYESPVWNEVPNAKDVALGGDAEEVDVTTRKNAGFKATVAGLKDASVEFDMVWDTEDADFSAFQDAFFATTPAEKAIEVAVMDGDIAVAGNEGLRATMAVTNFSRNEPLGEALTVSVTLKPTYADNPPEWYVVPA